MNYQAAKQHILRILKNELSDDLCYHGIHHTHDVLRITKELCQYEGVNGEDEILLKTAALLHDIGFTIGNPDHEKKSCIITRKLLPKYLYSEAQIEAICAMILATKIPQSPKTKLEEILCDADLDYLGRDDFQPIAHTLFIELKNHKVVDREYDWNKIQIDFIEKHEYFTQTSKIRRESKKQLHLSYLKSLL